MDLVEGEGGGAVELGGVHLHLPVHEAERGLRLDAIGAEVMPRHEPPPVVAPREHRVRRPRSVAEVEDRLQRGPLGELQLPEAKPHLDHRRQALPSADAE
ncbi:MAG: hypothetical protein HYU66_16185 [Armatimonadetes bacterium]|nr:hypothetical protein [Armatimonadota bacterium]